MLLGCPICDKEVECNLEKGNRGIRIRGEMVELEYDFYKCSSCEGEFYIPQQDQKPIEKAFRIYRKKHGMLQPEEIKSIRGKFGLTQIEFSRLLGWGATTLSRYENGALQSKAHDKELQLAREPRNITTLIETHPEPILPIKKERFIKSLKESFSRRGYSTATEYSHVGMLITQIYLKETRDADKESEVYIVSAVADGIGEEPLQVQSLIFEDITPLKALPITGDGFAIYRNTPGELPDNLDYAIAVMESDAGYRDAGELIKQVTSSDDFASLTSQIVSAAAASAPVVNIAFGVLRIAAGLLKANADDPLLKTVGSLTRGLGYQLKGKPLTKVESRYAAMHFGVSLW